MRHLGRLVLIFLLPCLAFFLSAPIHAIELGQLDDFEDGTTQNWTGATLGVASDANGNQFLNITSDGRDEPGGRAATFNTTQWSGDFLGAGVGAVEAKFRSALGPDPLEIRVVFFAADGSRFTSTSAQFLIPDGQWHSFTFDFSEAALTRVLGAATYLETVSNVRSLQFRQQEGPPAADGTRVVADLDIDDIVALAAAETCAGIGDADMDEICDDIDNCVNFANADQADGGGIGSTVPDGIGDACQCGNVTGDGTVSATDAIVLKRQLLGLPPGLTAPGNCDVNGDGNCSATDAILINRALLGLPPGVAQICPNALPPPFPDFCGGIAGFPCPMGQVCVIGPGMCQVSDSAGTCMIRPDQCGQIFDPVCGCDGTTFPNACSATVAGVTIDFAGPCEPI